MIKSIIIKCPFCNSESELFLSINPTVIVLNCPECWTPLMYDNEEIRILSEYELNKISAPSSKTATNQHNDTNKNFDKPSSDENYSYIRNETNSDVLVPVPNSVNRGVISNDDIIDLKIELGQCMDIQQFIEKM
jgi:hypothetical protein